MEITESVNEKGQKVFKVKIPVGLPKRHWWEFRKKKEDKINEEQKVIRAKEALSKVMHDYKEDVNFDEPTGNIQ